MNYLILTIVSLFSLNVFSAEVETNCLAMNQSREKKIQKQVKTHTKGATATRQ